MKIIHSLENFFCVQKDVNPQEQLGLLLTNKSGGFFWLDSDPASRYQGWFIAQKTESGKKMIKVLDSIEVDQTGPVEVLKNNFFGYVRKRGKLTESFFVPSYHDCLVYETDRLATCDLVFDVAECQDRSDWERHYQITREDGFTIIEYNHKGLPLGKVFIVIKFDGTDNGLPQNWLKRDYGYDRARNSPPFERYVFRALNVCAKKIVLAVSDDLDFAKKEARYVFQKTESLKKLKRKKNIGLLRSFLKNKRIGELKIKNRLLIANIFCALRSLDSFIVDTDDFFGFYAGFPWFYRLWNRDEAVCLKALAEFDEKAALKIFSRRLGELEAAEFKTGAADEAGWFFLRAGSFISSGLIRGEEKKRLVFALGKTIDRGLAEITLGGLAYNSRKETWMDSLDRSGARIEIQAMRLMMYRLAKDLARSPREQERYAALESALLNLVRARFWDGQCLADGFDPRSGETDRTVRPNIFLAAYFYPKLLDKTDWIKCFKYVLPKLWLDWGGLASVDKNSPEFHATHTGEDPASYHNGDSWFYLNDIAAIVMGRFDPKRFDYNIKKIFEAGSYDLLWSGISGFAAELSPASRFDSAGSPAQAWTSAAFLELLLEVDPRIISDRNL
jgi:hypothetical protein